MIPGHNPGKPFWENYPKPLGPRRATFDRESQFVVIEEGGVPSTAFIPAWGEEYFDELE